MDFFKIFSSSKSSPKDIAKDRLKLILINDRGSLSPELLEVIKSEILAVLSRYEEFDTSDVEISLTQAEQEMGNSPALVASIPIKSVRR